MNDALTDGVPAMLMRGGTSKGAYFLVEDLPADPGARNALLLSIMGSPDPRQIDGIGGAHPLTSKVAVVSRSDDDEADLDYLFLQVVVDEPLVTETQTCGNIIAGVGPFAVERGLIEATGESTSVRIRMVNTGAIAIETFRTSDGRPVYAGDTQIDGVPGTAAAIEIEMAELTPVLPTGRVVDEAGGHRVTIVDNGMPVVLLDAREFGVTGSESPAELEADADLAASVERVRLAAGELMGLGDARENTVPKMILVSAPAHGGTIGTRAFIPHRVHEAIGVLMAASVAAGIAIPGAVGHELAVLPVDGQPYGIEHPSGRFDAKVRIERDADGVWRGSSTSVRTARKLFDGRVYPR